mgnify:CR=1 FL=1
MVRSAAKTVVDVPVDVTQNLPVPEQVRQGTTPYMITRIDLIHEPMGR